MEIVAEVTFIESEVNTQDALRVLLEGYALNAPNQNRQWNSLPSHRVNLCTGLSNWLCALNNLYHCELHECVSAEKKSLPLLFILNDSCQARLPKTMLGTLASSYHSDSRSKQKWMSHSSWKMVGEVPAVRTSELQYQQPHRWRVEKSGRPYIFLGPLIYPQFVLVIFDRHTDDLRPINNEVEMSLCISTEEGM